MNLHFFNQINIGIFSVFSYFIFTMSQISSPIKEPERFPSVGPCIVQAVLLVDQYQRSEKGYRFLASSLPGHLIQVVISGRTQHEANGRRYSLEPGALIWYHEDELVRGVVLEAPWVFYTLNFIAPLLSPPPFEQRVRKVNDAMIRRFQSLVTHWRDRAASPAVREMRVQSGLLDILSSLQSTEGKPYETDPSARLWWTLETELRRDLSQPVDLETMQRLTRRSPATIARSCFRAVGMPPMKRLKQIRMSFARGLVQRSDLTMSEIGERIGFSRVHEFSRDYHRHHGLAPTKDRKAAG